MVFTDEDLAGLREILPDREDADHVFQAIKAGLDYFITCDKRTILAYASQIESRFPIRLRLPSDLVKELGL